MFRTESESEALIDKGKAKEERRGEERRGEEKKMSVCVGGGVCGQMSTNESAEVWMKELSDRNSRSKNQE